MFIAGNHDITLDVPYYDKYWEEYGRTKTDVAAVRACVERCGATYLEDSSVNILGLKIYGCVLLLSGTIMVC